MKSEAKTLVHAKDITEYWRQAARHSKAGRGERAASLWVRALRSARALGAESTVRALVADMQRPPSLKVGPPLTPAIRLPARTGRSCSLNVQTPFVRMQMPRNRVEKLRDTGPFDVVVDCSRQRVTIRGEELPLEGREIPLKILAALARADGAPLSLAELFPRAWGRSFNPAYDANTVYFHISRLRKLLEGANPDVAVLATGDQGYSLAKGLKYALVEDRPAVQRPGRNRSQLLSLLADHRFVDNRSYCQLAGVSRSTALRELAELVEEGVLVREGAGRGARYRVV